MTTLASPPPVDETLLEHRYVEVEPGVRLHCVTMGKGPLVVLLHGFPELWYAWRRQIQALVDAGFRVVAPDQRGYNLSDKPAGVAAYGTARLVEDVVAIIRAFGEEKARVVGHDWGAGVAWATAMEHPEMVEQLVVLNGPHPERLLHAFTHSLQLIRSWYIFFFQLPWLPEEIAQLDGYKLLLTPLREEPLSPEAFTREDLARYAEAFARPGALTAMINWYRGIFRGKQVKTRRTEVPVLVLWGEKDRHLELEMATPSAELVPNARVVLIAEATHWVQHDAPARVNGELVAFFLEARG